MTGTIIIAIIILVLLYFGVYRNTKVLFLEDKIFDGCYGNILKLLDSYDGDEDLQAHYGEYQKYGNKMVDLSDKVPQLAKIFSFKPIKLESWYTQEEAEAIDKGFVYYRNNYGKQK